jgi:hypothetical protein
MQNIDVRQDSRIGALTGTGYSVPAIASNNTSANNVSSILLPSASGIKGETDETQGGNSTSKTSINREVIDGTDRMVINMELTLNRGHQAPWGNIQISDNGIVEKAKTASGIRFKVYGDGKRWYLEFATKEAADYAFYRSVINTRRNRVTTVNISYTSLRQPADWGKRVVFNKSSLYQLQFSRIPADGFGTSSIKVFDIEFY